MTKEVHPQTHPDAVNAIRRLRAAGYPIARLAEHFQLSRQTVSRIVNRKTFTQVVDIGEPLEVYEPIKTKPRAKSTPAPAPGNTLRDFASRYKSTSATPTPTPAPAATPSPSPTPGARPGDVRREPSPEPPRQPPRRPSTGGYSAGGLGGTPKGGF